MKNTQRYRPFELGTAALVLSFALIFYLVWYPYHLFFTEQMQLFLLTPEYFETYLSKPAVLANYLGDFFTQFYFLRGGGPIVITLHMLLLWLLIRGLVKHFSGKRKFSVLAMLPVVMVMALHANIFYTLASTEALILTLLFIRFTVFIRSSVLRLATGVVFIPLVYWACGGYVILFATLLVMLEWRPMARLRIHQIIVPIIILFSGVLIPLIAKGQYLMTTQQAYLLPAQNTGQLHFWNYMPAITLIGIILLSGVSFTPSRWMIFSEIIVILFTGGFALRQNTDFNLEKILSIDSELYFNNLEKAKNYSDKYQLKSSVGAYFRNLIAARMNQLPQEMLAGPQTGITGLFLPVNNRQNFITITFSNEVYYFLGDVNASQHSALLGMIFSPKNQSSRLMRRLVQINIINGEYAVAEKFIRMLEKSMFHRQWATSMRQYLYNEKRCAETPWISRKRAMRPLSDELKSSNDNEKTMQLLLQRNPRNQAAEDYLNCYYLLEKKVDKFAGHCLQQSPALLQNLPEYFQEGLLIYYTGHPDEPIWKRVRISPETAKAFRNYTEAFVKHKGDGKALQEKFRNTYWFYYHYATNHDN